MLARGADVNAKSERCMRTLPEREEDDALDGRELEERREGLEEVGGRVVEEEQRVERERDGEVVHERDVEVAARRREVAVRVEAHALQDHRHDREHHLH